MVGNPSQAVYSLSVGVSRWCAWVRRMVRLWRPVIIHMLHRIASQVVLSNSISKTKAEQKQSKVMIYPRIPREGSAPCRKRTEAPTNSKRKAAVHQASALALSLSFSFCPAAAPRFTNRNGNCLPSFSRPLISGRTTIPSFCLMTSSSTDSTVYARNMVIASTLISTFAKR